VKGENGTSNPTQPRRPGCESAGATAAETHPTLLDIARPPLPEILRPVAGRGSTSKAIVLSRPRSRELVVYRQPGSLLPSCYQGSAIQDKKRAGTTSPSRPFS